MTAERLPSDATVRAIIEAPIRQLVEIGLEGGRRSALHMLAMHCVIKLSLNGAIEELQQLQQEINDAIACAQEEAGGVQ